MMSVVVEIEHGFAAVNPRVVFDLKPYIPFLGRNYALHPDGRRFIMVRLGDDPLGSSQLISVQNWLEEVKRLVPTD